MIKSLDHKGIQQFFETGLNAGISSEHEVKLATHLTFTFEGEDAILVDYQDYH